MYKEIPAAGSGRIRPRTSGGSGCNPVQWTAIVLELSDRAIAGTHR